MGVLNPETDVMGEGEAGEQHSLRLLQRLADVEGGEHVQAAVHGGEGGAVQQLVGLLPAQRRLRDPR